MEENMHTVFCSTVIPTIGRETLERAVGSVLGQVLKAGHFEIIVVNDSGQPLPEAEWQRAACVQIVQTNRRERSVARNAGAALARGEYLHFLDDDDWLLPGALEDFRRLAEETKGAWLYGGSQLVNREGELLIELHHELRGNCFTAVMAGEWVPLQSSLVRADSFFAIGGFNPHIAGPEDIDLHRRLALHHDIYGMSEVVACIGRGQEKSSTDYDRSPELSRWARERILDEQGVLSRMRASAATPFLSGRAVRAYATSVVWNLQRKRMTTGASRALFAVAAVLAAGPVVFSPDFWRAVLGPYESPTFARGFVSVDDSNE